MKKLIALSLLASVAALPTFAEKPSYNFVEGGYTEFGEFDGLQLRGNLDLGSNIFINADLEITSADAGFITVDRDVTTLGVGYKFDTSNSTSFYAALNYVDVSVYLAGFGGSVDGLQLAGGVRTQLAPSTELYGELAFTDYDSGSTTELNIGVRQKITDSFGAYVDYKYDEESEEDGFGVGVTWNF